MTRLHYMNEHVEPIQGDHSSMVKFPDANDAAYESVKYKLVTMGAYGLGTRAARRGM